MGRERLRRLVAGALISGTAVSVASTVALALLARSEGKCAVRAVNAPSQWVHGAARGHPCRVDTRHTLLGYAIHHAASVFWGVVFHAARLTSPQRPALADAAGIAALAAVVDYGVVPRRLTPGWEHVLGPGSIGVVYAALAGALWLTAGSSAPAREERGRSGGAALHACNRR